MTSNDLKGKGGQGGEGREGRGWGEGKEGRGGGQTDWPSRGFADVIEDSYVKNDKEREEKRKGLKEAVQGNENEELKERRSKRERKRKKKLWCIKMFEKRMKIHEE